ncbi:MAG: cysteine--tRNA ligase [Sphaerochaetaceae bacterium]|nr:cysteine--tRNA ligase [Sphaerochaetaceae bacterium]MDX9809369.1 cysteine--tRNA ligase [Sphaerochaetaceae bacterium]NLV85125.1 cysteine--tRNA ligase [Spirochaetales bacterium]
MNVSLFNTMSRSIEPFEPISNSFVRMYCCGPTVYNFAHIGNLRTYIFEDILRRTLDYSGYEVKHVMNITDVGHLTGDNDDGEDKMLKTSQETGRDVYEIARFYTDAFFSDTDELHILRPSIACKATEHIDVMIALIQRLEKLGHTYFAGGNVYFSIDTFSDYGRLARLNLDELQSGARIDIDPNKRNPKDFVLWFTKSKFENQAMLWDSPWGVGYPGWHIECSAMSMHYLGESFDIHCGGIDHIGVHHTNEIAQSEAATGKTWVNYWIHGEFLVNDTGKMSKSKGEFLTLQLLKEQGFDPMDYRYFCIGGHYRSQLQFSWEALQAAANGRKNLFEKIASLMKQASYAHNLSDQAKQYIEQFETFLGNDLNAPRGLAVLWSMLRDKTLSDSEKLACAFQMDRILGFNLAEIKPIVDEVSIPQNILELVSQRTEAKRNKNYKRADELRAIVEEAGYQIKDTPGETIVSRRCNQN